MRSNAARIERTTEITDLPQVSRQGAEPTVRLTVKLRGRTEAPHGAEGAKSLSARGAKPQAHHGPLQRLLDGMMMSSTDGQNRGITLSDPQRKVVRQSGTKFGHFLGPFLNSEGDPPDVALINDCGR